MSEVKLSTTVILQFLIDSGCGSTKILGRFITETQGQSTDDVLLLSETHGIFESFGAYAQLFVKYYLNCLHQYGRALQLQKIGIYFAAFLLQASRIIIQNWGSQLFAENIHASGAVIL